jgi:3-oxoacyl-[acyl-carrier protein] reductase
VAKVLSEALAAQFGLDGRVAVVTGGASGIGEATCLVLGDAGAAVVVVDIDEPGAARTAARIVEAGGRAVAHRTDTTLRGDVEAAVDRAVAEFGGLDIMCNVAGVPSDGLIEDVTEAELDRVVAINLKGVVFGCQAAVRAMKERGGGVIVNVSSTGIDVPVPGNGVYAMTKAAVAMLSMVLATEAGPYGIRVNAIAPGATITNFSQRHHYDEEGNVSQEKFDAFVERMRDFSPLRLVGEAMDQALLILYLVSPAARYATGNIFRVNGGQAMAW